MPQLLYLLASVGLLFLALVVVVTARRARGALPLCLLCLALFVWDFAQAARLQADASPWWVYVRLLGSSLAPAFLWHFAALFSQRAWNLRAWTLGLYVFTAVFWASTAAVFVSPTAARWVDGPWWNLSYLVIFLPFMVAALVLVVSHARRSEEPVERNAALYVAVGIAVGVVTAITELVAPAYTGIPRLGHIGTALCTVLLAVAILRHRLLLDEAPAGRLLVAVLLVLSAALVLGVAVPAVPEPVGGGLLAAVLVAVVALALRRLLFDRLRERIERRERLALVGTMAAGVAHEVRNPLAAIRGAAQFVQREVEIGKLPGESADYLKLILGEVDRLDGVVESFLAFARPMEPKRKDVDPKALVADVVRLQPDPARVTVEVEPGLGPLSADPALLASALSNIVRNAVEAGGKVRVRATSERDGLRAVAAFEVEDDGPGIPEAERDRVGLPFHTTKTKGTGLGVAIAIRAAEAHGGTLAYEPVEPHGCRFTIRIPLRSL